MKNRINILISLILMLVSMPGSAQDQSIRGILTDARNGDPIAYANIYNVKTGGGSISDERGRFEIGISGIKDTIRISFIGYQTVFITPDPSSERYQIRMEPSGLMLDEVIVTPKESDALYRLLVACRKNAPYDPQTSRAYFILKSFSEGQQMEMVEAFYNVHSSGYDLDSLDLKAGRIALQPRENRYFVSLDGSRAIQMLRLFENSADYPETPLPFSFGRMKRRFYLDLDRKYLSEEGDSIFVISYHPKGSKNDRYSGRIWVNASESLVLRIESGIQKTLIHPFLPLFDSDQIQDVQMQVSRTYRIWNNQLVPDHIDLSYSVRYASRPGRLEASIYTVTSQALLYFYNYDEAFFIPEFDFGGIAVDDYRKINAFPYQEFFWKNHTEYDVYDVLNSNERFFDDPVSITNKSIFKKLPNGRSRLLQHPYVMWTRERVRLKEIVPEDDGHSPGNKILSDLYRLKATIYMDMNRYGDSTDIQTAAILDPYHSFYKLPMDSSTHCFINIYFDLCEWQRRRLEQDIQRALKNNDPDVRALYKDRMVLYEKERQEYLSEVSRGTNRSALGTWNQLIDEKLGINNFALFGIKE